MKKNLDLLFNAPPPKKIVKENDLFYIYNFSFYFKKYLFLKGLLPP